MFRNTVCNHRLFFEQYWVNPETSILFLFLIQQSPGRHHLRMSSTLSFLLRGERKSSKLHLPSKLYTHVRLAVLACPGKKCPKKICIFRISSPIELGSSSYSQRLRRCERRRVWRAAKAVPESILLRMVRAHLRKPSSTFSPVRALVSRNISSARNDVRRKIKNTRTHAQ